MSKLVPTGTLTFKKSSGNVTGYYIYYNTEDTKVSYSDTKVDTATMNPVPTPDVTTGIITITLPLTGMVAVDTNQIAIGVAPYDSLGNVGEIQQIIAKYPNVAPPAVSNLSHTATTGPDVGWVPQLDATQK